jgi:hypothetical protein
VTESHYTSRLALYSEQPYVQKARMFRKAALVVDSAAFMRPSFASVDM